MDQITHLVADYAAEALVGLAIAALTWLGKRATDILDGWLGERQVDALRARLGEAIDRALDAGFAKGIDRDMLEDQVADYIRGTMADTLSRLGVRVEDLQDRISADAARKDPAKNV